MNYEKIRNFIKILREEQGWSQEELANKLYFDRTKISRLENGKRNPQLDDIFSLSEIFNVSIEELLAGERKTENNAIQMQNSTKLFLKEQNIRMKKMKIFIIGLLLVLLISFLGLTVLYFFQNYSSIRIYKVYGSSETYQINDGILILSKKKMYFTINNVEPIVNEIEIFSEVNGEKKLFYKGSPNQVLSDFYGYNTFVSYNDFIESKQNIYVKIKNEEIKLNFIEDFVNDDFIYEKVTEIGTTDDSISNEAIPEKIKKYFKCENNSCSLENNGEVIFYMNNILTVNKENIFIVYDISTSSFDYQNNDEKNKLEFSIINGDIICKTGNCEKSKKIFDDFTNNYINKYVK